MSYWYNVTTGEVETDENRSRGDQVLGPYETEAEAREALARARANTERWDEEDKEWDDRGASREWVDSGETGESDDDA